MEAVIFSNSATSFVQNFYCINRHHFYLDNWSELIPNKNLFMAHLTYQVENLLFYEFRWLNDSLVMNTDHQRRSSTSWRSTWTHHAVRRQWKVHRRQWRSSRFQWRGIYSQYHCIRDGATYHDRDYWVGRHQPSSNCSHACVSLWSFIIYTRDQHRNFTSCQRGTY